MDQEKPGSDHCHRRDQRSSRQSTFQEQLNKAANAGTVFEIAKEAGLNVQANVSHSLQPRGDDLETISGGAMNPFQTLGC